MKKLLTAAAFSVGLAISAASAAQAAPDCEASSFSFTACSGSYALGGGQNDVTDGGADNLATQQLNDNNLFGDGDWNFGAKYDGSTSGSNQEGFSVTGLGSTSGSFSFSNMDWETTEVAISLKSAKGYSLYYLTADDLNEDGELSWDTVGTHTNKKGKAQALSHISYYTRISAITPEVESRLRKVPEPAAMSGLLLVGMAAARYRKKKASCRFTE